MIFEIIFLFAFCIILAFLEIQIEGKSGWATNLPTWKPHHTHWAQKIYRKFMSGKDLTGYHIGMFALVLFVLHGFYFWHEQWSWQHQLQVIGLFFLVSVIWDFLWFVLNPYFGWKHFTPAKIAWHKSWLGPWPLDYYYGLIGYIFFYSISQYPSWFSGLTVSLTLGGGLLFLTFITTLIRVVYDRQT